jgi:hypothetical protein
MNRIEERFARLRERRQKGFVVYIGAGDPDLEATRRLALAFDQAGVDVVELGVPFSDPLADGLVNQLAAQRGLESGTTPPKVLETVGAIRKESEVPIVLYIYYNLIHKVGLKRFIADAARAGVDGLLVLDQCVGRDSVVFESRYSGTLAVNRDGERFALDFPSKPPARTDDVDSFERMLGCRPAETWAADNHLVVLESETQLAELRPDLRAIATLAPRALIATAPGDSSDFVSRFFAPAHGIDEDAATGSAHCTLTPYWSQRLGKSSIHGMQISQRRGEFFCENRGDRVSIAGRCQLYLDGTIRVA